MCICDKSVTDLITSVNVKSLNIKYRKTTDVHAVGNWSNP